MIRIILLLLLMIAHHRVSASSSTTKRLINNSNSNTKAEYPRALTLKQFSSVLKFDRYERFEERNNLRTLLANSDEIWESKVSSFWIGAKEMQENSTNLNKEGSSSSSSKSVKNEAQQLHPFLLCHLDKTSTSGRQRYVIIKEEITKKENDSNSYFFMNELPVYNHNFDEDEYKSQKQQQQEHDVEKESDEEEIPYGACFYGSMSYLLAKDVKGSNTFVTPMFTDLKIRRGASLMSNGENTDHEKIIAVSVQFAPGIATSQQQVMELAYTLLDIEKNISKDSSLPSCIESSKLLTSMSVTVSSIDISSFTYEVDKSNNKQNIISNECVMYFIEYLAKQPEVLSVSPVFQTIMLNDIASWIIQGYPEENDSRPWFDKGIRGEGEIVQLLDSGIDESSCYLKDASGEVPLTTDYDLTEGRIDPTKRKIVQYVALNAFNGDRSDGTSHGTHIAATIAGKRSDDGVAEIDGMVDGISPGVKLAFFDAHNDPADDSFAIPSDISLLFYFGRQAGARIHSASWGVLENAEYSERVRLIDSYFYNDADDEFVMFAAAGNDGLDGNSTIYDPSLAKNVISVGASHSHGDDLSNNMRGMDYIAAFSSRGPTADGRIKPDIVAPGHSILSAAANTGKCDPGDRPKYDQDNKEHAGLMFMSGTSMACPVAVGAGALVRQYFREVYVPSLDISGTLLKAVLVNGGEALVGRSKSVYGTDFDISTQYDEFQGFGRVNLMNSLKHPSPNVDSPDVHVEDARVLQQGQTHKYEFNVCDSREFRVTIAWKDPPNDSAGCAICLVNDLDLKVLYGGQTYYPNGRTNRDDRNNVERVILSRDDFSSSDSNSVIVKVKANNLGFGTLQKYSLASTGCFDSNEVELIGSDSVSKCEDDEFEYAIDIFTNRKPEETSWILKKQGNDKVIAAVIAGEYDERVDRLKSFRYKGCITNGCYIFIIKDTGFDGLCCEKGMGSYSIGADNEVLIESDSFVDRQKIEKFCHYGTDAIEPTTSPTALVCDDDEFKYQIDIETDLYPDETRWELLKKPRIDGVDEGNYTESYTEYVHEGCLDDGGCYSFSVYGYGEYTIKANEFIVADKERFRRGKYEELCYAGESINSTASYGIRTAVVGSNWDDKFDDVHPLWEYGKIVQIELYATSYGVCFIGITYETGQSFEHGGKSGTQHIITLGGDQYITKVSGRSDNYIRNLKFETNYGEIFGPYGYSGSSSYTPFEFDFDGNALVYIFGRADNYEVRQLGFAHASLPQAITDSPTFQPTSLPCGDNQYRYEIIIRTGGYYPKETWWELHSIVDSVPFMTYQNQLESYSHTGCLTIDGNYEFQMIDRRRDGLCCYFGSGSYKLSVDSSVVVRDNHFDDATRVGDYLYPDYVYNKHEFSYSLTLQPTSNPIKMTCSGEEFEYRIRVRTDYEPGYIGWKFKYSNGTLIESIGRDEYFLQYYEYNYRGCLPLDECFEFFIQSHYGLCCEYGNGGYTVFADNVVMVEGGESDGNDSDWSEIKTFCYGPSYSFSPSLLPTSSSHPSSSPTILVCNENEFKYEVVVTTDRFPWQTSWELNYTNGTIIDRVEQGEYTEIGTEHVHSGCIDLDSCVIFTIFDSWGGICCGWGNGGYTIFANDVVVAEGGEFDSEETKTFCYGSSVTYYPSVTIEICENGSNIDSYCGYWESIGLCEDNNVKDWMQENCAKACSNCCMNYNGDWWCDYYASRGRCTATSQFDQSITWEEFMQATCRYSCDTCDLDFTPSPNTPPVTCSDDQFKYEIIVTNDDSYLRWDLNYKYSDIDGYVDSFEGQFPPNYEKRFYGCASYSCFDLEVQTAYLKMYDKDKDILIAQSTERFEDLRFCHYAPEPTTSPTVSLSPSYPFAEAIFTISLKFSTSQSIAEDISKVVQRSVLKIFFHAQIENENIVTDILDGSCGTESKICDIIMQACTDSCGEEEEPDFLAFVGNTMKEVEANGQLLLTIKATADHMDVGILDSLTQVHPIFYDFEYDAWPTTSPTTLPSTQGCNTPTVIQNLFGFITNIFQPITQTITNTLFGVESYESIDITTCTDKMFELQLEIKTDESPEKTSWELLYENGTIIESIGRDTYSEFDAVYNHSYCLDTSCFVFNLFDSFEFKGSYNITVGDTVLAQQDSFMWWKDTKYFCYPQCDDDGMFALQIDVVTDPWPHETSWQLAFANGTLVDSVDEGYYTGLNTSYSHRYCLQEECYSVTFHDHIGDGMCCSYGDGSYMIKINDDEIAVKQGGKFEESESTTFCYPFDDVSCKGCEDDEKSLFEKITYILSKQREV